MQYLKPPIVEAVLEVSFSDTLELDDLEKIADKEFKLYRNRDLRAEVDTIISYDPIKKTTSATPRVDQVGWELSTQDALDIIFLERSKIATIRRAPYKGWGEFIGKSGDNYKHYLKSKKFRKSRRIGLRYVNRIDIPTPEGQATDPGEYVRLVPQRLPSERQEIFSYVIQYSRPSRIEKVQYNLICSLDQSPVPYHYSIVLDIDVYKSIDGHFSLDELVSTASALRELKNEIFESAITDRCRALFGGTK